VVTKSSSCTEEGEKGVLLSVWIRLLEAAEKRDRDSVADYLPRE
jgi:hypothetical protein